MNECNVLLDLKDDNPQTGFHVHDNYPRLHSTFTRRLFSLSTSHPRFYIYIYIYNYKLTTPIPLR